MLEATRGKSAVYSVRLGGGGHCGSRKVTSEKDIAENPEISWQLSLFRPLNHYNCQEYSAEAVISMEW